MKEVLACLLLIRETSNESLQKERMLKTTCVNLDNECNDDIKCVPRKRGRGTKELNKNVCKRCQPSVAYKGKKYFERSIKTAPFSKLETRI